MPSTPLPSDIPISEETVGMQFFIALIFVCVIENVI